MSSTLDSPWPVQTHPPTPPTTPRKRKRKPHSPSASSSKLARRQLALGDQVDEAASRCQWASGNEVLSCFPTTDTVIPQGQWASFVWNSRLPDFTQTDLVDIYLFRADSQRQVVHFPKVQNPSGRAGRQTALVNDTWWGTDGEKWNGSNLSYPFYWMVVRSDRGIRNTDLPQARFTAVQTTYADSVVASSIAATATASKSSQASGIPTSPTGGGVNDGSLANGNGGSDFPHWAIAVIVVLGFLALAALCILSFFLLRRHRRREYELHRNSISSGSPMMANVQNNTSPQSPLMATSPAHHHQPHPDLVSHPAPPASLGHDGASTISRANSAGEQAPFSGADAAIMADAFRQALRKPDFASRPVEEGESPDDPDAQRRKEDVLNRELAEEGRDIRSVSSSRGVRVETLSDSGDTVHDHR